MAAHNKKQYSDGEALRAKLAALRADLEALQNDLKGVAGDAGDAAAAKINSAIGDALGSVQDMADRVEDWSEDNIASMRESIREQPLASCALAMGAGALLWAILFRR
nr:MAG: DUF883 family protein [Hyphomicrobiales bacterium]